MSYAKHVTICFENFRVRDACTHKYSILKQQILYFVKQNVKSYKMTLKVIGTCSIVQTDLKCMLMFYHQFASSPDFMAQSLHFVQGTRLHSMKQLIQHSPSSRYKNKFCLVRTMEIVHMRQVSLQDRDMIFIIII